MVVYYPSKTFVLVNQSMRSFPIQKQQNLKHHANLSNAYVKVHTFGNFIPKRDKLPSFLFFSLRIVIFSKNPITKVQVSIDSKDLGEAIQSTDNENLYVLPWNSTFYNDGLLHDLSVNIQDSRNNQLQVENEFSLATTTITAWTRSKFILYIHWPTFVTILSLNKTIFIDGICFFF